MNTKLRNVSIAESFQFAFGYCKASKTSAETEKVSN